MRAGDSRWLAPVRATNMKQKNMKQLTIILVLADLATTFAHDKSLH